MDSGLEGILSTLGIIRAGKLAGCGKGNWKNKVSKPWYTPGPVIVIDPEELLNWIFPELSEITTVASCNRVELLDPLDTSTVSVTRLWQVIGGSVPARVYVS